MITVTDIKEALQAGGLELVKSENIKANLGLRPERVFAEQLYRITKYEDPSGVVWGVPTAWAYFSACRAHHWHRHQLRQNGIEPCRIKEDAPLQPENETLEPIMAWGIVPSLRDVVLDFGHEHLGWPSADDAGDELRDAAEALAVKVAERLGYNTDSYWGRQGVELAE